MNIARLAVAAASCVLVFARSAEAERPAPPPVSCPDSFDGEGSDADQAIARSLAGKSAYEACRAAPTTCAADCENARLEPGNCYPTGVINDDGTVLATYFTCTATLFPLTR